MILYCTADLIWATKIKGTADQLGIPCRPARSIEMLEARLADSPVCALMLDLDAPELSLELLDRVRRPDVSGRRIHVLCFGPHVEVELFEVARRGGADTVMARGALSANLGEVLTKLAAGRASGAGSREA